MKSLLNHLQSKPHPVRVALAGIVSVVAFFVSPTVISAAPFAFPMAFGPLVMVVIPALALKLIQRDLSVISIAVSAWVAETAMADTSALLVDQTARNPWLGSVIYFGGFVAVWYGALWLCAWLVKLVVAHRKRGQLTRAAVIAGGLAVLVGAGLAGLHHITVSRPIYQTVSMDQRQTEDRKARILGIYESLGLSSDYQLVSEEIFGEKRLYSWDKGRSFSSSRSYVRDADVDSTVAELRPRIEQAGFVFIGEPYPGSVDVQLHFRSVKGEYIRLRVSSKPRDDAVQAAHGKDINYGSLPTHQGPSNVVIKVNLDDNNE